MKRPKLIPPRGEHDKVTWLLWAITAIMVLVIISGAAIAFYWAFIHGPSTNPDSLMLPVEYLV